MSTGFKLYPTKATEEMVRAGMGVGDDNCLYWKHPAVAYKDMLAVAPQPPALGGEPVAWRNFDGEGNYDFTEEIETAERWAVHNGDKYKDWCQALFLHAQPATVKVVLPERMKTRPFQTVDRGSPSYVSGYNACLDEVAKLNGGQS